jgi:hypothetical protein
MAERLGEAQSLLAVDVALRQFALFTEDPREIATGQDSGKAGQAEPLTAPALTQQVHHFGQKIFGPPEVGRSDVSHSKIQVPRHQKRHVA